MELKKKIKLLVILLLVPIWLAQVYGPPIPLFFFFTVLLSAVVISLFSYWIKKLIIIPIILLVMGAFLIWMSLAVKGVVIEWTMVGTILIGIALVTAVFVFASSYAKNLNIIT